MQLFPSAIRTAVVSDDGALVVARSVNGLALRRRGQHALPAAPHDSVQQTTYTMRRRRETRGTAAQVDASTGRKHRVSTHVPLRGVGTQPWAARRESAAQQLVMKAGKAEGCSGYSMQRRRAGCAGVTRHARSGTTAAQCVGRAELWRSEAISVQPKEKRRGCSAAGALEYCASLGVPHE